MARSYGPIRRLEAAILLGAAPLLRALSARRRAALGRAVGLLIHALDANHRRLARRNIEQALGVTPQRASEIARRAFQHFGRVTAEVIGMPATLDRPDLFEFEGWEHLEAAYRRGGGVLVYSAHIGNWELVAQQQAKRGIPMDLVARPLDTPGFDRAFQQWREAAGNRVIGKHGARRPSLKTLKAGGAIAILVDQAQRVPPRLFVPFFGRPAATTPTLGVLAVRMQAAIVPVVSIPREAGGYLIRYEPELQYSRTGTEEQQALAATLAATRTLERWIREQPHTWLWMHDRWKWHPGPGETVVSG
jgi:KDO2-lipid IV(A) lauroyltransferase